MKPSSQPLETESARPAERVVVAVLLAVLALPGLTTLLPARPASPETEQRPLAPWPERPDSWAAVRTYPVRMQAYLDDHFGFREPLIRLHNRIACRLLGSSPSSKVLIGKDRWLYFAGDRQADDASPIEDYLGTAPLSPAKLEALRWMFADQHAYLRELGVPYYLFLIPSKPSLYPEHLPGRLRRTGQPYWREQLTAYLRAHTEVPVVDLTEAVRAGKETRRVYIPSDSHWNEYGGFLGYQAILHALQPDFPELAPMAEGAFEVRTPVVPGGDLARLLYLEDDYAAERIYLTPNTPRRGQAVPASDYEYADMTGGVGDPALPTAVVYRDSFANILVPYLSEHFNSVRYEWGQRGTQMRGIESEHPDLVLQLMVDRVLNQHLAYPARIQNEFTRRRFETAAHTYAAYSEATGFAGIEIRGAEPAAYPGGLALESGRHPIRIALPALADLDRFLPIVHLRIRPTAGSTVTLRPYFRGRRHQPDPIGRQRAESGTNDLYFPILDPESSHPLVLELDPHADYLLYALEIRGYPR